MVDLLRKNLMIGLGLASMTQEKIRELGKKLAEESKIPEAEGERLVKELLAAAEENKQNIEGKVKELVEKALGKIDLPCNRNAAVLEAQVRELREAVDRLAAKIDGGSAKA